MNGNVLVAENGEIVYKKSFGYADFQNQSEPFDYEVAKQKVKEQLRSGKSLFGKEGAFAPLLQEMLNSIRKYRPAWSIRSAIASNISLAKTKRSS